ncbi:MAG: hypothetical protein JXR63_09725 [Spirochaetales bacterium]|nr:hypothetical protein [Spirochaetales bacterium]
MLNFLFAKVPGKTTPEMLEQVMQDPSTLKWYIVPMFLVVLYIFVTELKNKNYNILFGAAAFWLMDVFNETWNSMVYATTGQPVWGTTADGGSALQILVGYNIEISFMFFVLGVVACKLLKTSTDAEGSSFWDGNKNWLSDPNNMYYKANVCSCKLSAEQRRIKRKAVITRVGTAVIGAITAVIIEILLNACGVLTWEKSWWQPAMPIILFIIGYCPFYFAAYIVHDLPRKWQIVAISVIFAVTLTLLIVAGSLGMLGSQIETGWKWL